MWGPAVIAVAGVVALGACTGRAARPSGSAGDAGVGRDGASTSDGGGGSELFDCADRASFSDPRCQRALDVAPGSIGEGPAFLEEPRGGFVDGDELVVVFHRDIAPGFVMSVRLDDGARTLRSGTYDNPALGLQMVGEGPPLLRPADVERGPDGWYVLAEGGLFRVDPATGDRTLARPFDGCSFGGEPTQLVLRGFAMDADGMAYVPGLSVIAGAGVFALAGDGSCEVVTWSENRGYEGRGSGPEAPGALFSGLSLHEGSLYATYLNTEMLYRIDLATGDRVGVSSSYDAAPVGTGDEILAGGFLHFSSTARVYSTGTGRGSVHVTEIDLATGARIARAAEVGPMRDAWSEQPLVVAHSSAEALVLGLEESIQILEPGRGNSFTLSR